MKATFACLALLCFCAVLAPSRIEVKAEPESAGDAFKKRPFNEHLDWDEARVQVGKGLRGDEKAKTEIDKGGLVYLPLILSVRSVAAVNWGYSLVDQYKDWIEAMQGWEVALLRNDTAAVAKLYEQLKPRFQNAEAQLTRAIIHAWRLGDSAAANALIALEPKGKLVAVAKAYAGIGMGPREAAKTMMAEIEGVRTLGRYALRLNPVYLDEEMRDSDINDDEVIKAYFGKMFTSDRIEDLRPLPREWELGTYGERMAALALETGDKDFIAEIDSQFAQSCGDNYEKDPRYITFHVAAGYPLPKSANFAASVELAAARSSGPVLAAWAVSRTASGFDLENAVAAAVGLYGNPDLNAARVFCLKLCLEYPDDLAGILAIRAVMALRDDRLDGLYNAGRALAANAHWSEKAQAFAKALEASKHPKLADLAKLMAKGTMDERPPAGADEALGLSVEQRAALLQVFVSADETAGHGGVLGVYWLNRALFAEARYAHVAATEFYAAAACAAAASTKRKAGNVNSVFWIDFVGRRFGEEEQPALFERYKAQFPELKSIIEAESALAADKNGKPEERAFYIARDLVQAGKPVPAATIKILETDLSRGGGMGVLFCAYNALNTKNSPGWQKYMSRAPQASPLDMDVLFANGPTNERFGFNAKCQFESAAHGALRLSLVQPDWINTFARVGDTLGVQGSPCVALSALYRNSARRSLTKFSRIPGIAHLHYLICAGEDSRDWFKEMIHAWGDQIPNEDQRAAANLMYVLNWHHDAQDNLSYVSHAALRPDFMRRSYDVLSVYYAAEDVNYVLNYTLKIARHDPTRALELIQRAEVLGVNDYGHFVGSQAYVRSKAQLGKVDDALRRYKEMRGKDVGYPEYLDRFLLLGMMEGNQFKRLDDVFTAMKDYEPNPKDQQCTFVRRRALMAAGRYADVALESALKSDARMLNIARIAEYSAAFHEARAHLDNEEFIALQQATEPFINNHALGMIGETLDAALLQALADKEIGGALGVPDDKGRLHILEPEWLNFWVDIGPLLDAAALEVLAGTRAWDDLPAADARHYWHGAKYPERPGVNNGSGFLSAGECEARDPFVRGMLAYLTDHKDKAREYFEACVAKDQRCSHEYHVAQWLLDKRLKPEEKK